MVAAVLTSAALMALTPQQKAALVVVSGLPAPAGVGGVILQRFDRDAPRPPGALVFVDQEGGTVRAFPGLPPGPSARAVRDKAQAYATGRSTGLALRRLGVQVDLAPVLDLSDGPLGARQFRSPFFGVAFARGLAAGGAGACAKHFPGLGTLAVSTDRQPYVRGHVRDADLAPPRGSRGRSAVRHGRARRLPDTRSTARRARAGDVPAAAEDARLPWDHDHRLAQRRPRPGCRVGARGGSSGRRPPSLEQPGRGSSGSQGASAPCPGGCARRPYRQDSPAASGV